MKLLSTLGFDDTRIGLCPCRVVPPPNAPHLAALIPAARLDTIPRMGHALPFALIPALADAILAHTAEV
jgi:pimeloyl-ACP methyl ester carboxylesterase